MASQQSPPLSPASSVSVIDPPAATATVDPPPTFSPSPRTPTPRTVHATAVAVTAAGYPAPSPATEKDLVPFPDDPAATTTDPPRRRRPVALTKPPPSLSLSRASSLPRSESSAAGAIIAANAAATVSLEREMAALAVARAQATQDFNQSIHNLRTSFSATTAAVLDVSRHLFGVLMLQARQNPTFRTFLTVAGGLSVVPLALFALFALAVLGGSLVTAASPNPGISLVVVNGSILTLALSILLPIETGILVVAGGIAVTYNKGPELLGALGVQAPPTRPAVTDGRAASPAARPGGRSRLTLVDGSSEQELPLLAGASRDVRSARSETSARKTDKEKGMRASRERFHQAAGRIVAEAEALGPEAELRRRR
ncbi:hypothetical protein DFJ73DRAFT_775747 [Zopfochytrium polystomum]|nr:hypothetical protein DFJ73DRAFT_775747 [Zopfochytrium polystomum]